MRAALLDVARAAGWALESGQVVRHMRELDLLPQEDERSGERLVRKPRDLDATQQEGGGTSISQELPTVAQELGAPRRPQGRPVYTVPFSPETLPMQLFSGLRRSWDGVVELIGRSGPDAAEQSLSIEIYRGRILAAHDSSALMPLGRMLQEASLLSPQELAKAIGESRRANLRLGAFLVGQRRLRESTLARLLAEQTRARLAQWFDGKSGQLSIFVEESAGPNSVGEREPASVAALVAALRVGMNAARLERALSPVMNAVILPVPGVNPTNLAFTDPETRALRTTLEGGAYEGLAVQRVIASVEQERIARRGEAMFALFVALSAGFIHAPGFGR